MHPDMAGLLLASHDVVLNAGDAIDPDLKSLFGTMHNVVINTSGDGTSLTDAVIALGVIFMCVVVPVVLGFKHASQKTQARIRAATPADQFASTELWDRARRMETRIEYLERVLDAEMPGWRNRS